MKKLLYTFLFIGTLGCIAAPVAAQTPNTAAVVVIVNDQSGAVLNDARVTITGSL